MVTPDDRLRLEGPGHGCEAQRPNEALPVLVAPRARAPRWQTGRATLSVCSDPTTALAALERLQSKGAGPGLVAREVAIDAAKAVYRPCVAEHLSGLAKETCDAFSRLQAPEGHRRALLACLEQVERTRAPPGTMVFAAPGHCEAGADRCGRPLAHACRR